VELLEPDRPPPWPEPSVVAIGSFDGVHIGHRAVIDKLGSTARATAAGARSVVVVVTSEDADAGGRLLTPVAVRLELIAELGVDAALVAALRPSQRELDLLRPLAVLGARDVPEVRRDGRRVDAAWIRELLAAGDVRGAGRLLGRPHRVAGTVTRGDERGRLLGFPTANVAVGAETTLPGDGVYAGRFRRAAEGAGGTPHPAVLSVGRRPTFYEDGGPLVLEAYLLDFDDDLYDEAALVTFEARLRGAQERFDSTDALIAQMRIDVERARRELSS